MKKSLSTVLAILSVFAFNTLPLSAQDVWHKYAGNPVMEVGAAGSWDYDVLETPSVINNGSTYEMWYAGYGSVGWQIGHATSPDGIAWTKHAGNPVLTQGATGEWDQKAVGSPGIIYDGTTYKMWYNGRDSSNVQSIGYATSVDGINWTKHANNPIIVLSQGWEGTSLIGDPSVIFNGTTYKMWYHANPDNAAIGYATSTDGIAWTKYANNPVLEGTASESEWDLFVIYPDVILVDMGSSRLTMPSLSVPSLLVNFARGEDVVTTIVDGKILMQEREILFLDEFELTKEFSSARAGLIDRIGLK